VQAAFFIKENNIPVIPTSYILIESGKTTSVGYMSNTLPISAYISSSKSAVRSPECEK
jgi:putative glycerol-1-phosphate prenyltransferase